MISVLCLLTPSSPVVTTEALAEAAASTTRIEDKLHSIDAQFTVLGSNIQKLSKKFDFHSTASEHQMDQDEMWASLLQDRFTSIEVNLLYSYVCDTIICLHSQVTKMLPDLARTLPTLSSVLRRKNKNPRIQLAWESALEILGLQEADVKALSGFFITHSFNACYYPVNQRQSYTKDINSMISKLVKNPILQHSLLCAVSVVERGQL